jgi:hypothetical protein
MMPSQFVYWLSKQKYPSIIETQCNSMKNIINRAPNGDLIGILYYGRDELALQALNELKFRFANEMCALEEMSQDQEIL